MFGLVYWGTAARWRVCVQGLNDGDCYDDDGDIIQSRSFHEEGDQTRTNARTQERHLYLHTVGAYVHALGIWAGSNKGEMP